MIDIIFFSDGKSNTDYPSKLFEQISYEKVNIKFFKVSIITIINVYKIIFFHIINNKNLIINTHHFKGAFSIFLIKIIFKFNAFKKIKWVHTFHAENSRFKGFKRKLNFFVYRKSDYLVGASEKVTLNWSIFLNKKKNIKTINNGLSNKEYLIIKNTPKTLSESLKILWLGRFEKVKNPILLIEALDKIVNKDKKIDLFIIGNGSLYKKLKLKIKTFKEKRENKNIYIKLYTQMNRKTVLNNVGNAQIFINTSSSEAFCNAAMEALANKNCNLLLPDLETLKELYSFNNVIFYKKNSFQELAQKLDALIKKTNSEKTFYKNAVFPNKFKLEAAAKKYIKLYYDSFKD